MTAQDKKNPGQVREQARVRSSAGSEPSGGYSYHDDSRLESVRGATRTPANDTQTAQQPPRAGKGTMIGGFADPKLSAAQVRGAAEASARKPLSEPPEIGSWPPLPNVPNELAQQAGDDPLASERERAALPEGPWTRDEEDLPPTDPPMRTSMTGGAIWEAVAPVLGQHAALHRRGESEEPHSDPTEASMPAPMRIEPLPQPPAQPEQPPSASNQKLADEGPSSALADRLGERMSTTELDYRDPELAKLENLVERGDWEHLAHEIDASTVRRSPTVALLQVIAKRELMPTNEKGSRLNHDAIQALSLLLGVPPSSPLALLLAKRLLRRNPVWTAKQPATGLSIGIVFGGLAVGAGIGWLVTRILL